MKGVYRSVKQKRLQQHTTNFGDWSDTPLKHLKKTNNKLTEYEARERLDKLKNVTAYSQTVNEFDEIRITLKQGAPLLPRRKIRRLKLPFHKSLVLNLKEDGYPETCEYIKDLIVLDDMYSINEADRNVLKYNKSVLDTLAEGLKLAEKAKSKGNRTGEVQAFMDLALHFRNSESSYYWLAQELLEQSVELLNDPNDPVDSKVEATLRFVYSSFLFDIVQDLPKAKYHLQRSMNLSVGKNFWFINDDGERGDILYLQSCVILSKIILEEAYLQKDINIEDAIVSCRSCLRWAKQASDNYAIVTALSTLVQFYLAAGQLCTVLDLLQEHKRLCEQYKFYRELCEGYVMLSKYHETVENDKELIEVIEELISFALNHGIVDIAMKGHIKLSEIYGKRRMGKKMNHHAVAAYKYSIRIGGSKEATDLSRCLIGIAVGDQLWCEYKTILLASNDSVSYSWAHLVQWKHLRIPFISDVVNKLGQYQQEIEENYNMTRKYERIKREELDIERGKLKDIISTKSGRSLFQMRLTSVVSPRTTSIASSFRKPNYNISVGDSTASSLPESSPAVSSVSFKIEDQSS